MIIDELRHVHKMDAATDKLSLFKTLEAITIIANTIDIDSHSNVISMKTKRRRQGNGIILHVALINNGIPRLYIRRDSKIRYMFQSREMNIRKRYGPTIVKLDDIVRQAMTAGAIKTNNK